MSKLFTRLSDIIFRQKRIIFLFAERRFLWTEWKSTEKCKELPPITQLTEARLIIAKRQSVENLNRATGGK